MATDGCRLEFPVLGWNNFGGAGEYSAQVYGRTGINVVMTDVGLGNLIDSLDAAKSNGIQVIVFMETPATMKDFASDIGLQNNLRERIRAIKNHPGLYGYAYADEPELRVQNNGMYWLKDNFKLLLDIIREEDPSHPILAHTSGGGAMNMGVDPANSSPFFGYADMTGAVSYGVMNPKDYSDTNRYAWKYSDVVDAWSRMVQRSESTPGNKSKNYYFIAQADGMRPYYGNREGEDPYFLSYNEIRRQIDTMKAISDKFGAVWWYMYDWPNSDTNTSAWEIGMVNSPRLMSDVKLVNWELQQMYNAGKISTNYPVKVGCDGSSDSSHGIGLNNDGRVDLNDFLYWKNRYVNGNADLDQFLTWKGGYV